MNPIPSPSRPLGGGLHKGLLLLLLLFSLAARGQRLSVLSSNVENLLDTEANFEEKLSLTAQALADWSADLYALQEVQPSTATLNRLVQALNARSSDHYAAVTGVNRQSWFHQSAFLYKTGRLKPVGEAYSPYPNNSLYSARLRIQCFRDLANGEEFILSNNHFKSFNEPKTLENAEELASTLRQATDPDILIVGDLNAELEHAPCQHILQAGYVEEVERRYPQGYTYYYKGRYEYIDHAFASPTLSALVEDAKPLNVNVGDHPQYGYSDHDPLLITFDLRGGADAIHSPRSLLQAEEQWFSPQGLPARPRRGLYLHRTRESVRKVMVHSPHPTIANPK